MTGGVALISGWRLDALLERASHWQTVQEQMRLRHIGYHLAINGLSDNWAGAAAEEAYTLADHTLDRTISIVATASQLVTHTREAHAQLESGRQAVLDAVQRAESRGFRVHDDGSTEATAERLTVAAASPRPDAAFNRLQEEAQRWSEVVGYALSHLVEVDREMAEQLRQVCRDLLLVGADRSGAFDPSVPDSPEDRRRWWESLSPWERGDLALRRPDLLGSLDGLPTDVRDKANRARIDGLHRFWSDILAEHRSTLAELDARDPGGVDGPVTMAARQEVLDAIARADTRLRDLDAVREALVGDDRYLMHLDTDTGAQTRAAVAIGNPDVADHVSVTTGGITTTVNGSLVGMVGEADHLRQEAISQLRAADRESERVAVIAWLGYDAPQIADGGPGVVDIISRDSAERGAVDLNGFFRGLDAANGERDAHVGAFGHSYGSLTTSLALQHDPGHGVDNAVFYGSPGVGTNIFTSSPITEQLGVDAVHDMTGPHDPVAQIPWFGVNPAGIPGVEQLSTDPSITPDGISRDGADQHSDYARPADNGHLRTSGYNLAAILADTGNEVPQRRPGPQP